LATHLDGARIFNAAVKLNVSAEEAVRGFDSVSICLSKGLGAPVGSVLVGSKPLIDDARRWRKVLGGGMRQAGILAAAGLYALQHHVGRLAEDHDNAEHLARGLRAAGYSVSAPQTNILYLDLDADEVGALDAHLRAHGILASLSMCTRLVTHLDLSRAKIDAVIRAFHEFPRSAVGRPAVSRPA
jgi:threonine aldolase